MLGVTVPLKRATPLPPLTLPPPAPTVSPTGSERSSGRSAGGRLEGLGAPNIDRYRPICASHKRHGWHRVVRWDYWPERNEFIWVCGHSWHRPPSRPRRRADDDADVEWESLVTCGYKWIESAPHPRCTNCDRHTLELQKRGMVFGYYCTECQDFGHEQNADAR